MLNKLKFILLLFLSTSLLTGCSEEYIQEQKELQKVQEQIETTYLPEGYTIDTMETSDDKSIIQIVTDNYYHSENIPNLIVHLDTLKADKLISDFDINTYQTGGKYSDDQIVIIIKK